ncbi:ubiquitin-specific protease ubp2 [Coniothyrium glycines]
MAPGKTAPRLLQDLLTYDARFEERAGRNLLTTHPPPYDPSKPRTAAVPRRNCRHTLVNKHEQSHLWDADQGDDTCIDKVASYCTTCRWHFDVIVTTRTAHGRPCKVGDAEYPLHHFLLEADDGQDASAVLGSQHRPRSFTFRCSAPPCRARLRIDARPPRFSDHDVDKLTNKAVLRRRWELARDFAGERADTSSARSVDGPDYLNTYLLDSLNPVKGKARIPLLNKKFLKTFGRDCDAILVNLGFTKAQESEDDGSIAEVWYLPKPEEPKDSLELTLRNVIEDARYELNTIILQIPENERSSPPCRHQAMYPAPSRGELERALACRDYPKKLGRTETRSTNYEEDHPYYASLGVVGDFSDALVLFAYSRQATEDFDNQSYYFECLQDLATGRDSFELQTQVASLASQGLTTKRDADAAYRFFGIDPAHAHVIVDEHIIGSYKARLADISPAMVEETKKQLRVLGGVRNSDRIRAEAADAIETYEQALSWFDLDSTQADDFVTTMFHLKTQDNPSCSDTARKALTIIAEKRQSQRLYQFLKSGTMTEPEMDLGEAYALLGVNDRTGPVDLDVLKSMVDSADSIDVEKLQKAYAIVQQDQAQNHNNTATNPYISGQPREPEYPLHTWPVGLRNIGNTCYLNSVLQFLFTIKPLREMILDCDKYLQEPTPEALANKKVGRSAVTVERVLTAQKFIHELRALFERMISASTDTVQPDIKVAALALCRTDGPQVAAKPVGPTGGDSKDVPGLGSIDGIEVSGPLPRSDEVNDTTQLADTTMDDASDTSMQAMDLGSQKDIPTPPTREPPPIPARPDAQANISLSKVEESARQQDAAEVMGNIFDLLSCAIQGEGLLREDEQLDKIKELFFSDVTTVQKTAKEEKKLSELRDHFLVAAGNRDRSLYSAMDDDFGQGEIEGGGVRYDYIAKAAPIQIINLRRLQHQNNEVVYDRSHVSLDNPLYLDRYLEKTETLNPSQLLKLREAQWDEQRKFREVGAKRQKLQDTKIEGLDLADTVEEAGLFVEALQAEKAEIQQYEQKADSLPTPPPELAEVLHSRAGHLKQEREHLDELMIGLGGEIATVFKDQNNHPYRLHTVFTHRGNIRGGHYFVYIYDFQAGIWRSYNDEYVKLAEDKEVFGPLVSTGLVYVRADLAEKYTEAVCRHPEVPESSASDSKVTEIKDVDMADANDDGLPPSESTQDVKYNDIQILEGVAKESAGRQDSRPTPTPAKKMKFQQHRKREGDRQDSPPKRHQIIMETFDHANEVVQDDKDSDAQYIFGIDG